MLRDKLGALETNPSRSQQLKIKEDVYLEKKSRQLLEWTSTLKVDSHGQEEKCSMEAIHLSEQPYSTMSL